MFESNHEYIKIVNGEIVQISYILKTENMYINLVQYMKKEGMEISEDLLKRAEIALNRIIKSEARNAKYKRK